MFADPASKRYAYEGVAAAVADVESLVGSPVVEWSGPDDGTDAFQILLENDFEISGDLIGDRLVLSFAVVAGWSKGTSRAILGIEERRISKDRMPAGLPGFSTPEAAIASSLEIAREALAAAEAAIAAYGGSKGARKAHLEEIARYASAVAAGHVGSGGVVVETTLPSRWSEARIAVVGDDGPVDMTGDELRSLRDAMSPSVRAECFGHPPALVLEADVTPVDVRRLPSPVEAIRLVREFTSQCRVSTPDREGKEE